MITLPDFVFFSRRNRTYQVEKQFYVVEHVEKRTKHVERIKKHSKPKTKKNGQHLDLNLDDQKCRESVKGRQSRSAIMAATMLNCLTCC